MKTTIRKPGTPSLGTIVGSSTGESDRDPMSGGWEGTDDATSTAPSDLSGISVSPTGRLPEEPDIQKIADDEDEFEDVSDMKEINFPVWHPKMYVRMF